MFHVVDKHRDRCTAEVIEKFKDNKLEKVKCEKCPTVCQRKNMWKHKGNCKGQAPAP